MEALMEFSSWITAGLSALVMGGLTKVFGWKDTSFLALVGKLVEVDGAIVKTLKGVQPLFVAAIATLIGATGGLVTGSEVPVAEAVAAAPTVTVLSVVMRELWVRFVKPLLPPTE